MTNNQGIFLSIIDWIPASAGMTHELEFLGYGVGVGIGVLVGVGVEVAVGVGVTVGVGVMVGAIAQEPMVYLP